MQATEKAFDIIIARIVRRWLAEQIIEVRHGRDALLFGEAEQFCTGF
jgi:hypothetical protein